jgi:hypothetical protein
VTEDFMSSDLARRNAPADLPSTQASEAITQALEGLKAIRTFVKEQFIPGIDAGVIPGCGDKATLFLPGAQKATMYFNAYPTYKVREADLGGGHVSYRVRCILMSRSTGQQIGEGLGCASTREKKFLRGAGAGLKKCPSCGKAAVMKSKDKPEFFCWKKKDGCGRTFGLQHPELQGQAEPEAEAPYEVHNTVLKMAKKRAHVDAAMTLGCLSELFTQDIEDTYPMAEVRASVVEEPEPYHVNGEIVDPPRPSPTGKGSGLFTKEHVARTVEFNDWLTKQCANINFKWFADWDNRCERALAEGRDVPAKIDDVINPWQAKNHLVKWAVESERLDPTIVPEDARTRQSDALVALVYFRSPEDKQALIAEMGSYLNRQRQIKSGVIYRKFPDLAPEGWAEEQAEAAPERGDAYVGDIPHEAAVANGLSEQG